MIIQSIQEHLKAAIKRTFTTEVEKVAVTTPPSIDMGDFAVVCFQFAKALKTAPNIIAQKLVVALENDVIFESAIAVGYYLNLKIKTDYLFKQLADGILADNLPFYNLGSADPRKVMVEYLSPNTNKPLHLGHVRNGCLGMAMANIFTAIGCDVVKANLINDRGVHICKSMLAWKKWGDGQTPETTGMKGDHFVGDWYVRYSKEEKEHPEIEQEAMDLLLKWESGDPDVYKLWETMNGWVYQGFSQTYSRFGFEFNYFYYESETYKLGKDIINQGLDGGVFYRDTDGAVIADLPIDDFGPDQKGNAKRLTVLRTDGTSVYMTQDLGTAKLKFDEHQLDSSIYVVADEQNFHFQCLFYLLDKLGFSWAKDCHHLSYGMVELEGGRMKSREGRVVDADDLLDEVESLAIAEIKKRDLKCYLSDGEVNYRAKKIALGAIKFYLLQFNAPVKFDYVPDKSIAFEGPTGPYCMYTYARASNVARRAQEQEIFIKEEINWSCLEAAEERALAHCLINLREYMEAAADELNPAKVALGVYELARAFNQFYQAQPILIAPSDDLVSARLVLTEMCAQTIEFGLGLLGIDVLEEM